MSEKLVLKKWEKRRISTGLKADEVSVTRSGVTSIPREIVDRHFREGRVVVHYDDNLKIIALEPAGEDNLDAYKMKANDGERARSWSFSSKKFVSSLRVKVGRYKAHWDEERGMLMFEYKKVEDEDA